MNGVLTPAFFRVRQGDCDVVFSVDTERERVDAFPAAGFARNLKLL